MTSEVRTAEHDPASPAETLRQELSLAREQQVATSNILRIISQSPSDVQPVLDAIVSSAVRLLGGYSGAVTRLAGYRIELAALTNIDDAGDASLRAAFPQSLQSETAYARAIRSCSPINITDAQTDPSSPERTREIARARGYRSWIIVPLLHQGNAAGTISVTRTKAG